MLAKKRKKNISNELIFLLFIFFIGSFVCFYTIVEYGHLRNMTKGFPLYTSILLLVLCGVKLTCIIVKNSKDNKNNELPDENIEQSDFDDNKIKERKEFINSLFWIALLPLAFVLLGIRLSFPVFQIVYLKANRVNRIVTLIFAIVTYLIIHYFFGVVMGIYMFEGLIFGGKF